jgi:hypothetical protein
MNSNDKKVTFLGIGVLFAMLLIAVIFGSNASGGGDDDDRDPDDPFGKFTLYTERFSDSGDLQEGASQMSDMDLNGKLVRNVTATVTWTDETDPPGRPRIRQYTNQPDTFSLSMSDTGGNFSGSDQGANAQGQQGEVMVQISIEDQVLTEMLDQGYEGAMWSAEVTMVEAGIWTPRLGVLGLTDPGNSYSVVIEFEYYDIVEIRGD